MFHRSSRHIRELTIAGSITAAGLILFKYVPMSLFGRDILFDASGHLAIAIFVLYVLWFFVDQDQQWHLPFFLFAAVVLSIIAFQRIADNEHNDVGLLLGLILGLAAVGTAEWPKIGKRLKF